MSTDNETTRSIFKDYLLQEYSHIAEAHFKTTENISTFFKHYLAIMTIPIVLVAYLFNQGKSNELAQVIQTFKSYGGFFLLVVSFAGAAVMLHIINLRLDALLYARTVNGIRKYFYDIIDIDINTKLRMRTLPQTTFLPQYFERGFFLPVIFAFAILDSFYLGISLVIISNTHLIKDFFKNYNFSFSILFFLMHFVLYWIYARYRETGYLKSNIVGIDIDGVLNKHREHFCSLLKVKTGKEIYPTQITHIPVHELDLNISREDELRVFNDPKYWTGMPIEDNIPDNLRKLRNIFKFKLIIFTHRPWPNIEKLNKEEKKEIIQLWRNALYNFECKIYENKSNFWIVYKLRQLFNRFKKGSIINRITTLWLSSNSLEYNKLLIEKGNEDTTDPKGHFYNRFQLSRKKKIKYFVEDDLEKAIKLAFICDVIFLFDHPYNQPKDSVALPTNIIRVKSWNEIYRNIRRLS